LRVGEIARMPGGTTNIEACDAMRALALLCRGTPPGDLLCAGKLLRQGRDASTGSARGPRITDPIRMMLIAWHAGISATMRSPVPRCVARSSRTDVRVPEVNARADSVRLKRRRTASPAP
jgi:hypothetical protein